MTTSTALNVDQLREAMRARKLSAFRLAVAAGVTERSITNALAGRPVRSSTYHAILAALEATPVPPAVSPIPVGV